MTFERMWHMIRISLMKNGFRRAEYMKKKNIFAEIGDHCFWQPRNIPPEAKLIKLHDNVVIASEVLFVNHDVMHYMFDHMGTSSSVEKASQTKSSENAKMKSPKNLGYFRLNLGAIEIGSNVFIGSRSTVLPGAKIDNNAIFGAGSLITGKFYRGGYTLVYQLSV